MGISCDIYIYTVYIYIQIWVCPKRGDTPNIQLWLGNWWYNIKHSGVLHFQTKPLGIGKTFSSSCWLRDVGWGPKYLAKGFPECGCNVVNPLPQAFFLGMVFLFCTPKGKLGQRGRELNRSNIQHQAGFGTNASAPYGPLWFKWWPRRLRLSCYLQCRDA